MSRVGGVHGKPLSTIDRESRRKEKEWIKRSREHSLTGEELKIVIVNSDLVEKAREALKGLSVVTPYTLMSKLENVTYSVAKKLLEKLEEEGIVKLVSKNRRVSIYTKASAS